VSSKRTRSGWILASLAVAGVGVSLALLFVHQRIATFGDRYTSFCNVNETVNCDVVLSSNYASFLGLPVAGWAVLAYILLAALAVGAARTPRFSTRVFLSRMALGLTFWNAAFSLYLAAVAVFVIGAVCIMCTALYVVNILALGAAWVLHAAVRSERGRAGSAGATGWSPLAVGLAAGLAGIVVAAVLWKGLGAGDGRGNVERIARAHPEFYQWYVAQPVRAITYDGGNSWGNTRATVTIVEFSDFECTHCAKAYRVLKQVLPRYAGQVRVVFRHFPLDSSCNASLENDFHRNACAAAVAAECAAEQGKFWEYHDRLFENQTELGPESLLRYAHATGLDVDAFAKCLASVRPRQKVEQDIREAVRLGIKSTPTFFFNGRAIRGSLEPELFRYAIAIERSRRRPS